MELGNVVNETYTGVLDITVTLDFYTTSRRAPAARTANVVLPLQDQRREDSDLIGTATLPRNTTRLLGEVYVTGSGGGCEEFWDTSAPAETGYSCPDGSPYREVDVSIDGKLAGIALPYPYIYTGGWSNPYSWRPSPAPRAFDIKPLTYDLTPFAGLLTDGKPHEFRVHVERRTGRSERVVHRARTCTSGPTPHRSQTRGAITSYAVAPLTKTDEVTGHRHRGSVTDQGLPYAEDQRLRRHIGRTRPHDRPAHPAQHVRPHVWDAGETRDSLDASWRDTSIVTSGGKVELTDLDYGKNGLLTFLPNATIPGGYDVVTDLKIHDTIRTTRRTSTNETYDGRASWIYNVPRDQRHATGTQTVRFRVLRSGRLLRPHPASRQRRLHQGLPAAANEQRATPRSVRRSAPRPCGGCRWRRTVRGRVRPAPTGPDGCGRRTTGPGRPRAAGSAGPPVRRRARRPRISVASAGVIGSANSAWMLSEWPVKTGTRTQVPATGRSGMCRILRLSLRSFCSSSVSPVPSATIEPASGSTLNAIGPAYTLGCGQRDALGAAAPAAHRPRRARESDPRARSRRRHRSRRRPGTSRRPAGSGVASRNAAASSTGIAAIVVQFGLATMPFGRSFEVLRVDLGDDQRHLGVHPPGRTSCRPRQLPRPPPSARTPSTPSSRWRTAPARAHRSQPSPSPRP